MSCALYKNYLLVILLLTAAFSMGETTVLGQLMQPMAADLHLSDMQLGVLTGIAYALCHAPAAIFLGRWADRGNRVTILALMIVVLSVAMVGYTVAASFLQVLLIRGCVAMAAAGCSPAAVSLISDYFTRAERPRAFARFTLGWYLPSLIGSLAVGWLGELYGWRVTFGLLGLPGLMLAAVVRLTLKEPRVARPASGSGSALEEAVTAQQSDVAEAAPTALKDVLRNLWINVTTRHLLLYSVVGAFFSNGVTQFQSVFLIRSYGLKPGELGVWFAMMGLSALVGTYWGGGWASRYAANNERLQFKVGGAVYASLAPFSAMTYFTSHRYLTFALLGLTALVGAIPTGPILSAVQTAMPASQRATSYALMNLLGGLIGMGLGPLAAGALSDLLRPLLGQDSLRYASIALCPGYLWCGWHLWQAAKSVERDLETQRDRCPPAAIDSSAPHTEVISR